MNGIKEKLMDLKDESRGSHNVQIPLDKRGDEYGEYYDCAQNAQALKAIFYSNLRCTTMTQVERESLDMIATKLSRILSGSKFSRDSWLDIAGYATLVVFEHDRRGT
jgi:hypothetical protein